MKCKIDSDNKEHTEGLIVRRKFVPLKFTIHRENQFLNAEAKLPFTTNKIIGILTCSKVDSCIEEPFTSRFYVGVTENQMEDTSFLETNKGKEFNGNYPPDVTFDIFSDFKWWYFVHPIVDQLPTILLNGFDLGIEPKTIAVKVDGYCDPQDYYLWSGILPLEGTGVFISFTTSS